jgi:TnpA family transposase
MEDNKLVVDRIRAEEGSPSLKALNDEVDARLPLIELADLLLEVDSWTGFTSTFQHPAGRDPRTRDVTVHCYASLIAQARNLGLVRMAQASDLTYMKLAWVTTWYLRDETLKAANVKLVNYHHHLPLSGVWGGGTLSSSDGQRFPSSVKNVMAAAQPPYYGYGRGLTLYTWTSDQHSQYGSKPASSLIRDATYVLDEILDNETELPILEHTTDTAGYTDLVIALFDLLGLQFSPRLRDIGDQRLFRIDPAASYPNPDPLLTGNYINTELILKYWDDLLRVAGSLKVGWVTASLFIAKLQSYRRNNALTRALQEYGRLVRTIFILRWLDDPQYRRRIGAQLNKGEAIHSLRGFLFSGHEGQIRQRHHEDLVNQSACLNLVSNAIIV